MLGAGPKWALRRLILTPFRTPLYVPGGCNGGRIREDAAGVGASGFRLWSGPGLAGESAAEALPGLEEAEAAGQAGDNSEEAGPGLSACRGRSPSDPHSPRPTQHGSGEPLDCTPGGVLSRLCTASLHGLQERGLHLELRKVLSSLVTYSSGVTAQFNGMFDHVR